MATLSRGVFWDDLPILSMTWDLSDSLEQKATAGGAIVVAEYGDRFWYGSVICEARTHVEAEALKAKIRRAMRADVTFNASPRHADGRLVQPLDGKLFSVNAGRAVRLSNLAADRNFPAGTYFSLVYGGKRRLFQTVDAAATNGSGIFANEVDIVPDMPGGWTLNQDVEVQQPMVTARMVPGSIRETEIEGRMTRGVGFSWRQVFV